MQYQEILEKLNSIQQQLDGGMAKGKASIVKPLADKVLSASPEGNAETVSPIAKAEGSNTYAIVILCA